MKTYMHETRLWLSNSIQICGVFCMIVITGILSDEGIECKAMRADDGRLYTFTNLPNEIATGDRITIEGAKQRVSICQQGITIKLDAVKRHAGQEKPEKDWKF